MVNGIPKNLEFVFCKKRLLRLSLFLTIFSFINKLFLFKIFSSGFKSFVIEHPDKKIVLTTNNNRNFTTHAYLQDLKYAMCVLLRRRGSGTREIQSAEALEQRGWVVACRQKND